MVDFDHIARSKINFVSRDIINADMQNYVIEIVSQNSFHLIFHTSVAPWKWWTNTSEFSVLREMSYPLKCLTMLSPAIYTCFVLDGFRTFS